MAMLASRIGELAALGTAICWTATALSFESAGKRIGSLTVNLIRLAMAVVLFAIYGWIVHGVPVPLGASAQTWGWLALSGLVGFVIGDLLLFQAFVEVGARISMLVFSSVPPLTAILAWFALGEQLDAREIAGMIVTIGGIVLVVLKRGPAVAAAGDATQVVGGPEARPVARPPALSSRVKGILLAFGGALGQAGGVILGRIGAGVDMDPFSASHIRAIVGLLGFVVVFFVARRWKNVWKAVGNRPAMARITIGAIFGPFLGVSLGLLAVQNTSAGIASTIIALVPIIIIVPSVIIFKEKVTVREVLGAFVAVGGVALLVL